MGNELQLQNIALQAMQGTSVQGIVQQQLYGVQLGNGVSIGNILAGIDDYNNIAEGTPEQKASGLKNLLEKAISCAGKFFGNGETTAATKKVTENAKNSDKTESEAKTTEQKLTEVYNQTSDMIEQETGVIESAQKEIETANSKLQEEKEKIENAKKQIEAKKFLLQYMDPTAEDAETKQKALLEEIHGLSEQITASTQVISQAQEVIDCASKEVASSVSAIEELNAKAVQVQQEGQKKVTQLSQEAAKNAQDNAATQVSSANHQNVGDACEQMGNALSSNTFTSAFATKYYQAAADNKGAATVEQNGVSTNSGKISKGIGVIQKDTQLLSDFTTSIGSGFDKYVDCIGGWNNQLQQTIDGFGSLMEHSGEYQNMAGELKTATEADMKKLDGTETKTEENKNYVDRPTENNNSQSNVQYQQPPQFTPEILQSSDNQNKNDLETLKVNTELEM